MSGFGFKLTSPGLLSWFCLLTWSGSILGNGPVIVNVEEGRDVTLPCSLNTKEDIESKLFDWKKDGQKKKQVFMYDGGLHSNDGLPGQDEQFKGRVSHFEDELKSGDASIIIRKTKVADSGDYTCDFPRLQPRQIFHIQLLVAPILKDRSKENITGAAPEPYVTILKTEDGVLLQCDVRGASPQPKVEWQDSAGNILPAEEPQVSERGGRYNITLQTTVNKTDNFSCVVTQEEISHQTQAEIFALEFPTESSTESSTRLVVSLSVLGVVVGVLLTVLVFKLCKKETERETTTKTDPPSETRVPLNSP